MTWFKEALFEGFHQAHQVKRNLYRGRSRFQRIAVFESARYGRILALDGVVQTTEKDEFVYHEMLTHLPIMAHGKVRRVLIIGGGDGGILEEVLKHKAVEQATMVEIDAAVVAVSKRYLGSICRGAFRDKRAKLVVGDGARWVGETAERYDLIILDRPDPIGPAQVLFTRRFYANCRRVLRPGGILVAQSGVPIMQGKELAQVVRLLRRVFRHGGCYLAPVPTYVCGFVALAWASDRDITAVAPASVKKRLRAARLGALGYYNPDIHFGAFALPGYVRRLVA